MAQNGIIAFSSVGFSYPNNTTAIDDVSFSVDSGEYVCIIGENGSGKSTIAGLSDALIFPTKGTVRIDGMDTRNKDNVYNIRRQIGIVFQDPLEQSVATIVRDEVAFGPANLGISKEEVERRVSSALAKTGMTDAASCDMNTLSGGQLQKVAIASALAMEPKILILDEASSMLDSTSAKELRSLIATLREEGMTILSITHSKEEALASDRLIVMDAGRLIFDGKPCEEVLDSLFPPLPTKEMLGLTKVRSGSHILEREKRRAETVLEGLGQDEDIGSESILSLQDVWFSYDQAPQRSKGSGRRGADANDDEGYVLKGVTLEILKGDSISIMGANGSGKSTLIQHMNGLLRPTSGTVAVGGIETTDKDGANHARNLCGLCFQYPERQIFSSTVFDEIAFGLTARKADKDEIPERVADAMAAVGLDYEAFSGRNPFSLSGGEARRVAIASILATEPEVLIFDEPCASLDAKTHAAFLELLASLIRAGRTVVTVTHDVADARLLSNRIVCLKDGHIEEMD